MEDGDASVIAELARAFGDARDVTPVGQPLHVMLPTLALPDPWKPSPTRALTIWADWPNQRPRFAIDERVVGEGGEPPRSSTAVYLVGETWREFSFTFPWSGDAAERAVQLWMTRFVREPS